MPKQKVLLAEDDYTMVSLLKTLLKMEGYEVIALDAEDDVIQAVRSVKPDLLLMDVHLFSQNGLDILDKIREAGDTSSLRVLMSSGANVKDECLNHGANGFLMKPYMPDDLFKQLKNVLSI
ncbi:MAG: response regulator [Anaerolineales bacterium]|jgi:DNA-binding response OmpR family regulator|uniref:response regulator n=1 Tax=Candidatus Villigracilis vicinus TaxID=3140679 RepID=UPI003135D20E|nr:response regulator [Anaerolineales bacterium]MBK7451666.1 response regulator [Anaerolineales bacterium]MBK9782404.1 response regulator [Anaerolineales bacterium]